jgi:hypothetical protein
VRDEAAWCLLMEQPRQTYLELSRRDRDEWVSVWQAAHKPRR